MPGVSVLTAADDARLGEHVAVVDVGATVEPGAIQRLVDALTDPEADAAYADHVVVGSRGPERFFPPAFSPERLRHQAHWGPIVVVRGAVYSRVRGDTDPTSCHDLALRVSEMTDRIVRVPDALSSVPAEVAAQLDLAAIEAHLLRVGIDAAVESTDIAGVARITRRLAERPLVSVIIPTRGGDGFVFGSRRRYVVEAIRSIVERSTYTELEFVVVYDTSDTPAEVLAELSGLVPDRLVLVEFEATFNFPAKIAAGVQRSHGDLLLLLNDDTELIEPGSVEVMVGHLVDPGVAMVGCSLLFEDGTLQHGGHVYTGAIHHACFGWPGASPGPAPSHPLAVARECSGVTAGCALVRRSTFDAVGGLDLELPHNYNDVDFSLRLRAARHRIVWTPWARWYHFESRTRDPRLRPDEVALVERRWHTELADDPYYHPDLPRDRPDWRPSAPTPEPPDEPQRSLLGRARSFVGRTLLRRTFRRPHGVNLVGYLDATSGLGDRVRELEAVLREAGVRYSAWDVDQTDSALAGHARASNPDDGTVFDTTVAVVTALAFPGLEGIYPPLVHEVDRVIGYWFWELAAIPESHRPAISLVDEIWAPTRFVRDAYASSPWLPSGMPVELVPLPIRPPAPSCLTRGDLGFGDEFVFLCSFDHLSAMERKNPVGVVRAFRRAFPEGEAGVRLVVKSINGHLRPDAVALLSDAIAGDPRIEVRDGYLSDADQAALIAAADCFVSLHRSEGLGLHIAEAMWLRTPVIASDYSGNVDLTAPGPSGDVAALVKVDLVPVANGGEAYQEGVWGEPDLDEAARAMRRIIDDAEYRDALVGAARARADHLGDRGAAGRHIAALLG